MKRSPLRRKTALKPGKPPQRKTWIKRQSDKKRKEKRDTDGPREKYRLLFKKCQCCRKRRPDHTHEIASGGARCKAVYHREAQLAVCKRCHREIHETSEWPISRQLWAKRRTDPKWYDRRLINRLRGRNEETAIEEWEVDEWEPSH